MIPFGLENALVIFSRIMIATFHKFLHKCLEVYLDDWTIYNLLKDHVALLQLVLDSYRQLGISMNLWNYIFCVPFGIFLGHIVCKYGVLVDPVKIAIIMNLQAHVSIKQL